MHSWTLGTEHFTERFALFVIIALGETIVITGTTTAELEVIDTTTIAAFSLAFLGTAALWWLYFSSIQGRSEEALARATESVRVARDLYTYGHALLVAGIIVAAVGDELVIAHPEDELPTEELLPVVAGPALYLLAQAFFRFRITGQLSARRLGGVAALAVVWLVAGDLPAPRGCGAGGRGPRRALRCRLHRAARSRPEREDRGRMEPRMRPAVCEDGPALLALDAATWSPDVTPAPEPGREAPFFKDGDRPEDVLVAEVGGRPVGYIQLHRATKLASNAHVLQIRGLAVDPREQGRGVGRSLIEGAIAEARRRGARRLTLRVLAPNAAARAAYEAGGFQVEGVLRGEFLLGDRYVDDVVMALDLTTE